MKMMNIRRHFALHDTRDGRTTWIKTETFKKAQTSAVHSAEPTVFSLERSYKASYFLSRKVNGRLEQSLLDNSSTKNLFKKMFSKLSGNTWYYLGNHDLYGIMANSTGINIYKIILLPINLRRVQTP